MYTLLKSEVGSFPEPEWPQGVDLQLEDRKARRRLYPVTVIYSVYLGVLLILALRSPTLWSLSDSSPWAWWPGPPSSTSPTATSCMASFPRERD